jgi:alpha-beta hydrolase superfamily lysophospholipase
MILAADLAPRGTRRIAMSRGALFLGAAGNGPPLLCIPGAYHGAWCYEAWLASFGAAGIASGALDLRGKGTLIGALDPATGVDDYAEDVVEAAAKLCGAPVLVGHSLGALVAMRAAMRLGPDRVWRSTPVDSHVPERSARPGPVLSAMASTCLRVSDRGRSSPAAAADAAAISRRRALVKDRSPSASHGITIS